MARHDLCMETAAMLSPTFHVYFPRWQFPFRDGDFVRCYLGAEVVADVPFKAIESFLLMELASVLYGAWGPVAVITLPPPPPPSTRKPLAKMPLYDTTCPAYDPVWRGELRAKRKGRKR